VTLRVKSITLWRADVDNTPGALAAALEPLAASGADLEIVMGYAVPGESQRAVIEVFPVKGRKGIAAAQRAGLRPSATPTLLVEGINMPGLGHQLARSLAEAKINIRFLVTQVIGSRYASVFGFEDPAAMKKAAARIRKVSRPKRSTR